jgi:hypothetical protein
MLNKLSSLLNRISSIRIILILLFLFLITTSLIFPWVDSYYSPQDAQARKIDTQYYYSPAELYQIIGEYSRQGREIYAISHATADVIFPLVYAFFFGCVITYTFRRFFKLGSRVHKLHLVPFLLLAIDYVENLILIVLLLSYPSRIMWLAAIASITTPVKWLASVFTVFLFFMGIFGLIYLWIFRGRNIGA